MIPGEICAKSPERGNRSREASLSRAEVSRGHSSGNVKGRISRSSDYDRERKNGQMSAENIGTDGFLQGDSAERKRPVRAHRSFNRIWKERNSEEPDLLGAILERDNLNDAYLKVKANKGAPGVDGMTISATFQWLRSHHQELTDRIRRGKYTPQPVRRVEIPKPDGGIRKLGIPTVKDRIIQQAIAQQLILIFEPLFTEDSYAYRPGKSAQDAILKVKEYAEQGYTYAVLLDLSKYFDTLNHVILVNLLRREVKDERVIQMVKRYLRSGVMEGGVVKETEEGSPQGGNLSPLLANIYLNEFDQEYRKRGVPCIRYADDIVLLAKSERAAKRLLATSTKYLEGTLKLKVNQEKSRVVSVFSFHDFQFLGFTLSQKKGKVEIRVHEKSRKKFKARLKELTSRKFFRSTEKGLQGLRRYAEGWLNYFGIASMKTFIRDIDSWVRRRIRKRIWLMWKRVRTRIRKLIGLGIPKLNAIKAANSRKGAWRIARCEPTERALSNKRLVEMGYTEMLKLYQTIHINY